MPYCHDVKDLLKKAEAERKSPLDTQLFPLAPVKLSTLRANCHNEFGDVTTIVPTEHAFWWELHGHNASHRHGNSDSARRLWDDTHNWFNDFLQKHRCALVGGYVCSMLANTVYRDIDVFFYGNATYEQIIDAVFEFILHLKKKTDNISVMKRRDSLSVIVGFPYEYEEFQFVYRTFTNKADVLHTMDLGSCQCMWDGKQFLGTALAQFSFTYGVNILDLSEWGPHKELRIVKYFNNLFGLVLPDLDEGSIIIGRNDLPFLSVVVSYQARSILYGKLEARCTGNEVTERRDYFSYHYIGYSVKDNDEDERAAIAEHNVQTHARGEQNYIIYIDRVEGKEDLFRDTVPLDSGEAKLIQDMTQPQTHRRTVKKQQWYGSYAQSE